jgi:hypothetical protein
MLTGTSRPEREGGRSLNYEELQNLHSPPSIGVKKLKRMERAEHVSLLEQTKSVFSPVACSKDIR